MSGGRGGASVVLCSFASRRPLASLQAASLKAFINNITQSTGDASVEILLVDEEAADDRQPKQNSLLHYPFVGADSSVGHFYCDFSFFFYFMTLNSTKKKYESRKKFGRT